MCLLDPPGKLPPEITPWQLFWSGLLDQPQNGFYLDWQFVFMFRILLLVLVALAANWFMLGWVGRWLGLRMKHPGFAPIAALFLALAPPILLFSLVCYLSDRWHLTRMPERQFVPLMFQSNSRELLTLQRLHFVFQLRASARLALNRETEAGEDVFISLRLAQLARQSPDVNSALRVQVLLASSLQPVWEGLAEHRWSEPQLAAFQKELARFDLLTDHTNAIRRIVLAHVETWRAFPDTKGSVPQADGVYVRRREWAWQPRTWWYDNCR